MHVLRNVRRTVWEICSLMIRLKGISENSSRDTGERRSKNASFLFHFLNPLCPYPYQHWKLKILLYPEYTALAAQTNATFLHSPISHAIFVNPVPFQRMGLQ